MIEARLAQAISTAISSNLRNGSVHITTGIWVAAESVDANLSQVQVGDTTFRFIPKLSGVSPTAGQIVVMFSSPNMLTFIVGVLVGDITKATV